LSLRLTKLMKPHPEKKNNNTKLQYFVRESLCTKPDGTRKPTTKR
jgi:hypothetical protein